MKRFIVETVEITDCKTGESRTAKVITDTKELCSCEDLYELCDDLNKLAEENERLKNKLNVTALELVDEAISMGKAVEISEMDYHEFLEYRLNKGKPMELQR